MNSPQAPAVPDPVALANSQSNSNRATAVTQQQMNMINQKTPQGNLTYNQIGKYDDGTPHIEATTSLSPDQQQLYNTSLQSQQALGTLGNQQIDRLGNVLNTPYDLPGGKPFDVSTAVDNQYHDLTGKLLDPVWNARQAAQESQLYNQGIRPGSEAYINAMRDFNNTRNTAYDTMQLQGRGQAYAEALGGRQQAVQESLSTRNQPLNEISALMSGSQVSLPNFQQTPQTNVAGTDVIGAQQLSSNVAQNNFNQKMAQDNAMIGGLFSIPATAMGGWAGGGFKPPSFMK